MSASRCRLWEPLQAITAKIAAIGGVAIAAWLMLGVPGTYAEPSWYPAAVACGQWAETHICAGKAGCPSWQWEFSCVVKQAFPDQSLPQIKPRADWCTGELARLRARQGLFANQGDPIGDAMACLTGQQSDD